MGDYERNGQGFNHTAGALNALAEIVNKMPVKVSKCCCCRGSECDDRSCFTCSVCTHDHWIHVNSADNSENLKIRESRIKNRFLDVSDCPVCEGEKVIDRTLPADLGGNVATRTDACEFCGGTGQAWIEINPTKRKAVKNGHIPK